MERTLSQEERIRKAEEIYYRRKMSSGNGVRVSSDSVNVKKSKFSLFKKMSLQLAICAVIYIIFYLIKNSNYIFSEDVISKTKELLSYDINFNKIYSSVNSFIENNKERFSFLGVRSTNQNEIEEKNITQNEIKNNIINEVANETVNEITNEGGERENIIESSGIGGADINETIETSSNESSKKTQMELDAEYIKEKYSFKVPVKGTVTSRYGAREATEIVSANHQGIDIGANTGTAIYAAVEGTVTLVSSEGDYRKTYRSDKWSCYDKICTL